MRVQNSVKVKKNGEINLEPGRVRDNSMSLGKLSQKLVFGEGAMSSGE